ncbi:DUF4446 family protein [Candidatus Daviesbacteria bacterium]|nr:DUF4446 family protein [Candidatus Daviesbacteria bacterium]
MYSDWSVLTLGLAATVFIWLGILTIIIWKQGNFIKSLFPKSGERDIRKKFEEVIETVDKFNLSLDKLHSKLNHLEGASLGHIQRIGLIRFNPYEDTGGNISFSIALLDQKGNGLVLTSLHGRAGTRVFAKGVVEGKAQKYELSKEEIEVVKKAME